MAPSRWLDIFEQKPQNSFCVSQNHPRIMKSAVNVLRRQSQVRRQSQADSGIGVEAGMQAPNDFRPGTAAAATTKVDLSISCKNLIDKDTFSKSDPLCAVFMFDIAVNEWIEIGRTECIPNNLNPEFVTKIGVDYYFEERQLMKFEIYDIDNKSPRLQDHDFLGRLECSLGEIVANAKVQKSLTGVKRGKGAILISAEEQSSCKDELVMHFSASKLDKKDFFGKSDPFLAFYKTNMDGTQTIIHRTEYIPKTLNPTWKPVTISVRKLCSGDMSRDILVKCIDWNRDGSEDLIGEFHTSVNDLLQTKAGQAKSWQLSKAKTGKSIVTLNSIVNQQMITFVDHIQAGCQLNCTIAVDFTASNGNPTTPGTLHYHQPPNQPSQYAQALTAVGTIIQDYDSDKLFPVLGYGARLPPRGEVSHNFFVNGNPSNPYCEGIPGVLAAYQNALRSVQLYGPTNFAPIIQHVAQMASQRLDGSEYFILLIITDGIITDMPNTKDAIVAAASLPLSIIIVGVGQADFKAMQELDGDTVRLTNRLGQPATRDIVQFVPFRQYSKNLAVSQSKLAKEVLAEIPDQFVAWMRANNIRPSAQRYAAQSPVSAALPTPSTGVYPNVAEPPPPYSAYA